MRHLSQITVEEGAALWDFIMPIGKKPFQGSAHKYPAIGKRSERVVFMSGVERMGIYFNGHIWADSDMCPITLDQTKISQFLIGIGIEIRFPTRVATYLVWHAQNAPIASDECQLFQTEEPLSVPCTATFDEIKELFRVHLNKKYGEGYWKMEYFISLTEVSDAEISRTVQDKKGHHRSIFDNG